MNEPSTTGRCLCGAVRFRLAQPAKMATYCHCTRCQRRTGTSSSAQAQVDGAGFEITQGAERLRELGVKTLWEGAQPIRFERA